MLAHGRAVVSVRAVRRGLQLGICPNIAMEYPDRENCAADRRVVEARWVQERWYLDPFLRGRYPAAPWRSAEREGVAPRVSPGDLKEASPPLDFLGVNYYFSRFHRHRPGRSPVEVRRKLERTDLDWPFYPRGLCDMLVWVTKTYGRLPLYVTENGAAVFGEKPGRDGRVRDGKRTRYLALHAEGVRQAVARGADVRGYYVWSLMDNFEWSSGYRPRFGLVHVDYRTQKRTVKDSGRFYSRLAASNGACLAGSSFV
jgi:beta-glucosidase